MAWVAPGRSLRGGGFCARGGVLWWRSQSGAGPPGRGPRGGGADCPSDPAPGPLAVGAALPPQGVLQIQAEVSFCGRDYLAESRSTCWSGYPANASHGERAGFQGDHTARPAGVRASIRGPVRPRLPPPPQ